MKMKLIIIDSSDDPAQARRDPAPLRYFITEGHLDRWAYSPPGCGRIIETVFEKAED